MKGSVSTKTPPHELGTGAPSRPSTAHVLQTRTDTETHRALTAQKEGRDTRNRGDGLDGGASAFPNLLALHGLLRPGETTQGF